MGESETNAGCAGQPNSCWWFVGVASFLHGQLVQGMYVVGARKKGLHERVFEGLAHSLCAPSQAFARIAVALWVTS